MFIPLSLLCCRYLYFDTSKFLIQIIDFKPFLLSLSFIRVSVII